MKIKLFLSAVFIFLMIPSARAELSGMDDLMTGFTEKLQSVSNSYADSPDFILNDATASSVSAGASLYRYISAADGQDLLGDSLDNEFIFRAIPSYSWSESESSLAFNSYVDPENDSALSNVPLIVDTYLDSSIKNSKHGGFFVGQYFSEGFAFSKKLSDVPDPGSFFLLGLGALALALVRRKSAKSFI